ncbi:Carbon monoxide dehydrogenase subunit G [Actinokineospora alba]|uniref:Carbon monoxide dehydrogenase subunit G n=1 Tax=Actinokineospora alba TaxID=504798 RepID=A0A1H0NHB4_9PSEU|nr:SRPBCC family protein [Actinokineospora alba]TDP68717.1 carbon monoxide dehydrogenase subunit G [Actinokineospora alba]SDH85137.1 Carbon monoxide dehydrogenase subunit G [Actinokineospora alba]SDO91968.1 Carbon monoxide dehydrogenase subunit G [Actinokineospora alba]
MTRWYPLKAAAGDAVGTAATRHLHVVELAAPPAAVWSALTAPDTLVSWSPLITGVEWRTPRPFGVGTTRVVTLGPGLVSLRERFYRWEEGKRMTFSVEAATRPLFTTFGEDLRLDETLAGTRLTWTFAYSGVPALHQALKLGAPLTGRLLGGIAQGIRKVVEPSMRKGVAR